VIKKFLQKIFKKISYGIFLKIYGKVEHSIECEEDNRIKVEIISQEENLKYKIYKIPNSRLYTDRIQDAAVIIDNKIVEGPSFQFRYTKGTTICNSKSENNIVFNKGTPRKLINLKGKVLSILTGGAGNTNYWHWLFDVLPRIGLFNKVYSLNEIDYFLVPDIVKKFQYETLNSLEIPTNKILSSKKYRHIKAQELIVTDHPVVTTGNATKDILNIPIWITKWLQEKFIIKDKKIKTKIYIDRTDDKLKGIQLRSIKNENEIKKYLSSKNFIILKPHEISFFDQVNYFRSADCVVGLHGAAFANITFCRTGTKIIELKGLHAGAAIENLARKNNLNYYSIACQAKEVINYNFPNQQGQIEVPINSLSKILEG
jgi:capsular polysaccharide biosynthesis protein